MAKRKLNKNAVIASAEEAEKAASAWTVLHLSADDLRALARKIWEDAYAEGWADARSDAAVEAAEAEWFNS